MEVKIKMNEDGTYTVTGPDGVEQPATTVDEALAAAKTLLAGEGEPAEIEAAPEEIAGEAAPAAGGGKGIGGMLAYLNKGK